MDITVEKLYKSYGELKVFEDFSALFQERKTTCIMGESGCGKTTLFQMLLGLEKADSGKIEGVPYGKIAAVFQEDRLCENLSAASNLKLVCREKPKEENIREAFAQVRLEEIWKKPVRELSGGMKRRVAILRALFAEAECLFMDEPLRGLDEETKRQTAAYIRAQTKGKTLLVITHEKSELELLGAEEVLYLPQQTAVNRKEQRKKGIDGWKIEK